VNHSLVQDVVKGKIVINKKEEELHALQETLSTMENVSFFENDPCVVM